MLERGMLTSVMIFEYDHIKKRKILANFSNFYGETETDKEDPEVQNALKNNEVDYATPIMNIAISGIYYIDGLEFEYNKLREDIVQTLYLVKKGEIRNWDNKFAEPKVKET